MNKAEIKSTKIRWFRKGGGRHFEKEFERDKRKKRENTERKEWNEMKTENRVERGVQKVEKEWKIDRMETFYKRGGEREFIGKRGEVYVRKDRIEKKRVVIREGKRE